MKKRTELPIFFTTRRVCPCCGHEKFNADDLARWHLEMPRERTDRVLRGDGGDPPWSRELCWNVGGCSYDPGYRDPTITETGYPLGG